MPLILILRLVFSALSLVVLGAACWLLWSWYDGNLYVTVDGDIHVLLVDWRIWVGGILLLSSLLGKWLWVPLLSKADRGEALRPERTDGKMVEAATGGQVYVETSGPLDRPTVVLTHGWGMDSTIWFYLRRLLSRNFRVVVWDLPGTGKSMPNRRITLDAFAANLGRIVKDLEGDVVLVGHSIGGMTIQNLAKMQPELFGTKVKGVVLLNTTYTNPLKTMVLPGVALALRPLLELIFRLTVWLEPLAWANSWQSYLSGSTHMANRIAFGPRVTRSQLNYTSLLTTRNSPGAQAQGNLAMFRWDATDALTNTSVPVLVIGGKNDIVTKASASERIAATIPNAQLQIIPGANHMSFLDEADTYNPLVVSFCQSLLPRPAPKLVDATRLQSGVADRRVQ